VGFTGGAGRSVTVSTAKSHAPPFPAIKSAPDPHALPVTVRERVAAGPAGHAPRFEAGVSRSKLAKTQRSSSTSSDSSASRMLSRGACRGSVEPHQLPHGAGIRAGDQKWGRGLAGGEHLIHVSSSSGSSRLARVCVDQPISSLLETSLRRASNVLRNVRSHSTLGCSASGHASMSLIAAGNFTLTGITGCEGASGQQTTSGSPFACRRTIRRYSSAVRGRVCPAQVSSLSSSTSSADKEQGSACCGSSSSNSSCRTIERDIVERTAGGALHVGVRPSRLQSLPARPAFAGKQRGGPADCRVSIIHVRSILQ
jgi:hypothetical protein